MFDEQRQLIPEKRKRLGLKSLVSCQNKKKTKDNIKMGSLWVAFDAINSYPSTMAAVSFSETVFPEIESGYAFTKDINKDSDKLFKVQRFTKGSTILFLIFLIL